MVDEDDEVPIKSNLEWEEEFLGEMGLSKRKQKEKSELLQETDSNDWCVRARKTALRAMEDLSLSILRRTRS